MISNFHSPEGNPSQELLPNMSFIEIYFLRRTVISCMQKKKMHFKNAYHGIFLQNFDVKRLEKLSPTVPSSYASGF